MTTLDMLAKRNSDFATHRFTPNLSLMPALRVAIVGCVDPRVDPAHVLGIELGEAAVIRNIGGRITPATLQAMGMLRAIPQAEGMTPEIGFNLIVLHHTDCGITRLQAYPAMLAAYFGIDTDELATKAIADPYAAVALDVAMLKTNPLLPRDWLVSGLVYDVATGRIDTIVPAAPLE